MNEKRKHESDNEDSNDEWVGPKQTEIETQAEIKKRKSFFFVLLS